MRTIQKPTEQVIRQFLERQSNHGFSYPEVGFSKRNAVVNGYDNDLNRVQLGTGPKAFEAACEAIRTWKMFPGGWAQIEPVGARIQKGVTLAMTVHLFGLYWLNACIASLRIFMSFRQCVEYRFMAWKSIIFSVMK